MTPEELPILELAEVDSTNTYVREHYDELADGTLVSAYRQTAGRGRRGRVWVAPPGDCLCCSMTVKTPGDAAHLGYLAGLGALAALREAAPGIPFFLKWPNDVYAGACKIAGILCESARLADGKIAGAALGIGININQPQEVLAELDQPATSLRALTGDKFSRKKLLSALAKTLFRYYITFSKCPDRLFSEWREANGLLGREIEVEWSDGVRRIGVFEELCSDGALVLRSAGVRFVCRCGDVRIRKGSWTV